VANGLLLFAAIEKESIIMVYNHCIGQELPFDTFILPFNTFQLPHITWLLFVEEFWNILPPFCSNPNEIIKTIKCNFFNYRILKYHIKYDYLINKLNST
jgi:hypothetical protein